MVLMFLFVFACMKCPMTMLNLIKLFVEKCTYDEKDRKKKKNWTHVFHLEHSSTSLESDTNVSNLSVSFFSFNSFFRNYDTNYLNLHVMCSVRLYNGIKDTHKLH